MATRSKAIDHWRGLEAWLEGFLAEYECWRRVLMELTVAHKHYLPGRRALRVPVLLVLWKEHAEVTVAVLKVWAGPG